MYNRSARVYDAIYHAMSKDYAGETEKMGGLIRQYKHSAGNSLLDAGCGTGTHLTYLRAQFSVEGLDNSERMLAAAKVKFPDIPFHLADMAGFELGRRFDVITCLFSAIGYVQTLPRLSQAISTFARHLEPGGVALVEPWFGPGVLDTGEVHAVFVDEPQLKIARMNVNRVEGTLSYLDFNYMVGTRDGIEYFCETHALGIFTDEEYQQAFLDARLSLFHDEAGLDGRGLYIGIKPLEMNG